MNGFVTNKNARMTWRLRDVSGGKMFSYPILDFPRFLSVFRLEKVFSRKKLKFLKFWNFTVIF